MFRDDGMGWNMEITVFVRCANSIPIGGGRLYPWRRLVSRTIPSTPSKVFYVELTCSKNFSSLGEFVLTFK